MKCKISVFFCVLAISFNLFRADIRTHDQHTVIIEGTIEIYEVLNL